jgi:Tfp pilus assembly protein PilF
MMLTPRRLASAALLLTVLAGSASAQDFSSEAKVAFKEANRLYTQQAYAEAAEKYQEAIRLDPSLPGVFFYLANSYDNLYKPGRKGEAQNDEYLAKAVENYRKTAAVEKNQKIRKLALEYLVAAYGRDKLDDPGEAIPILEEMIDQDPADPTTYFVLAKTWEDGGEYEMAEGYLLRARQVSPGEKNVYLQLAGLYNRWGEFEKTMGALQEWADHAPLDAAAHYTISSYYWEKAYRDFRLRDTEKLNYIELGLKAADRALDLKADYAEALTYKNLLLRSKALVVEDPGEKQTLLDEADRLRDRAIELRKK